MVRCRAVSNRVTTNQYAGFEYLNAEMISVMLQLLHVRASWGLAEVNIELDSCNATNATRVTITQQIGPVLPCPGAIHDSSQGITIEVYIYLYGITAYYCLILPNPA